MKINLKLLAIMVFFSMILSFFVVWINIKVLDLSYTLQDLKRELKVQKELNEKLKVEFSNLTSRRYLLELAKKYKLKAPDLKSKIRIIGLRVLKKIDDEKEERTYTKF